MVTRTFYLSFFVPLEFRSQIDMICLSGGATCSVFESRCVAKRGFLSRARRLRLGVPAAASSSARLGIHAADGLPRMIAGDVVSCSSNHLQTVLSAAAVVWLSAVPGDVDVTAVQRAPGALLVLVGAAHVHIAPAAVKEPLPEDRPESVTPRAGELSVRAARGAVGVGVVPVARLSNVLVAVRVDEYPAVGTRGAGAAEELVLTDVAVDVIVHGRGAVDLLSMSVQHQDGPG